MLHWWSATSFLSQQPQAWTLHVFFLDSLPNPRKEIIYFWEKIFLLLHELCLISKEANNNWNNIFYILRSIPDIRPIKTFLVEVDLFEILKFFCAARTIEASEGMLMRGGWRLEVDGGKVAVYHPLKLNFNEISVTPIPKRSRVCSETRVKENLFCLLAKQAFLSTKLSIKSFSRCTWEKRKKSMHLP